MLNNTQTVDINRTDERILPENGIICIWRIARYVGKDWTNPYTKELVKELERHQIPIFKVSDDIGNWLVRLEDLKPLKNAQVSAQNVEVAP